MAHNPPEVDMKNIVRWLVIVAACVAGVALLGVPTAHAASVYDTHILVLGTLLATPILTLGDWAKRLDPDGKVPDIVEMLNQTNEVLDDMLFMEGNLVTGHRTTVRTGLPTVAWRLLNQGVAPSKSSTAQLDEACGMMEAWSEVDCDLADLGGNSNSFRLSEAQAFLEAMNQEFVQTLFYGNSGLAPEEFTGLSIRYSDTTAANGSNVIKSTTSPSGADQTSMWLMVWGRQSIFGIFPKGSKAGLSHADKGRQVLQTQAQIGATRLEVYQDKFEWKAGIALRDWRYVVRMCNIDVSALIAESGNADLLKVMTKATWRIPNIKSGRAVFYCNRTVGQYLDIQAQAKVSAGGQLGYSEVEGRRILSFRGIPIKTVDQLLETESIVA